MDIDDKPECIVLYATTNCNHKCSHCFVEHSTNWDADNLVEKNKEHSITEVHLLHHFNAMDDLQAVPGEIVEIVTKYMLDHGLLVHYNITVTKSNYKSISAICSQVRELGIS